MQFPARQESNVSTWLPVRIRLGTRLATRAVAELLKAQRGLCGRRAMEVKDAEVIPATADGDWGLVEALRQGEATAAECLVATFGDRAYRLAIGITGNQEDAEEAVQDAFLNVIRKIDTFRGGVIPFVDLPNHGERRLPEAPPRRTPTQRDHARRSPSPLPRGWPSYGSHHRLVDEALRPGDAEGAAGCPGLGARRATASLSGRHRPARRRRVVDSRGR